MTNLSQSVINMQKLSGGTVYDLSIHLVLVTKYRKKVINAAMLKRLEEIFAETCK
ncbi:MAG: transposase, partial [Waterburya sp.]